MSTTSLHICPLCEATCGLRITVDDGRVTGVRGDDRDVFSRGFVCPKGVAIGDLHHDPARLRQPLVREHDTLRPATWDEAFDRIRRDLGRIINESGPDAVGVYLGNPNAHNVTSTFYLPALVRALRTRYRFSASTVDQMPQQVALGLIYGTELSVPVPDIDRTELFVVIGGNPLVSNGSMMTVPDMPGRLRDLRNRGGRMIVIDPVRTRTAQAADTHIRIRPGTDVVLVAAIAATILREGLTDLASAGPHVDPAAVTGIADLLAPFTAELAADITGVDAATITGLARDLVTTPSALYGRLGTSTAGLPVDGELVPFTTLASWLIAVTNVLAGNLDVPGGVMFPLPPAGGPTTYGTPGTGRGARIPGSARTRVRDRPSAFGEFPSVAMAEEIGPEGIRALITVAGNPVVSIPQGDRLETALGDLDLLVCLDMYVTETSRHADVILPAPSPLSRSHYDVVFASLAVRNTARWSPAVFGLEPGEKDEGEVLLTLAGIAAAAAGGFPEPSPEQMDDLVAHELARQLGIEVTAAGDRRGVARLVDLSLRAGPFDLTLADLEQAPSGVDCGPLVPRLPEVLRTPSGQIEMLPEQMIGEVERLVACLPRVTRPALQLVGRRQLRTNNSWLRTVARLTGGSSRCTLQVHPEDAARRAVGDGQPAVLESAAGSITVTVEVTDAVMPGVVCMPHGWSDMSWAPGATTGANVNVLNPAATIDPLSGTAVLNAVPVQLSAIPG